MFRIKTSCTWCKNADENDTRATHLCEWLTYITQMAKLPLFQTVWKEIEVLRWVNIKQIPLWAWSCSESDKFPSLNFSLMYGVLYLHVYMKVFILQRCFDICCTLTLGQIFFSTDLEIRCKKAQSHQPVFIPCPNVSKIEAGKFQLLKNQTILCQLDTDWQMTCNQTEIKIQLCKSESKQIVGFNLTGPEIARDQAIYRCNAIIYYPPPYQLKESNERILIFTEGKYTKQGWNLKVYMLSWNLSNLSDCVSSKRSLLVQDRQM